MRIFDKQTWIAVIGTVISTILACWDWLAVLLVRTVGGTVDFAETFVGAVEAKAARVVYSSEVAVFWATLIALIWYAKFTYDAVEVDKKRQDRAGTAARSSLRAELGRLKEEIEWADEDERPSAVTPFDCPVVDHVLRHGELLYGRDGCDEEFIENLVQLREELRKLREYDELLVVEQRSDVSREKIRGERRRLRERVREILNRLFRSLGVDDDAA